MNKEVDLRKDIEISTSEGNESNKTEEDSDPFKFFISNENSIVIFGKKKLNLKISSFDLSIPKRKIKNNIVKEIYFSLLFKDDENDVMEDEFEYLIKIKPKGLKNLGGCCYMNSTLQCFFHIKEFTNYFLKNKKYILKKRGLISEGLLDTIEGLTKNGTNIFLSNKI